MFSLFRHSLFIILSLFISRTIFSQVPLSYYFPSSVHYNPSIPTPQSFFGFQVGELHFSPDQIHAYMRTLDAASDRITIEQMGETYEQRPIFLLTITSPENHRNIQSIKEQHKSLTDPSKSSTLNLDTMPVVVWIGYSVHGNEPSGSNASVLMAYHLAAAQGNEIEQELKDVIVLLNPSINPDGLNRFATWANMHKGNKLVADPQSREHNEIWPGGRTNHYWFDLNRDWMPLQHPESRGRLEKYYEWRPNVLTDHHEMGTNNTFFFQPGVPSRNNPLAPASVMNLTAKIAQYHARALDQIGSLYYSEEGFDDFYIGKGSSYPDITGGIGILFEQGSSRGHLQESIHGDVSFPFTIRNQLTTSFSTLKAAHDMRKELLAHQRDFYTAAIRESDRATIKAYVFGSSGDPVRAYHLVDILRRHEIQVYELSKPLRAEGTVFEPGAAYVVPTNQSQYRLLTSLFEKRTSFDDSLFYDVSTWRMPAAFNMRSAELKSLDRSLLGKEVQSTFPRGSVVGPTTDYAYVFEWTGYYAPRALYRFLKADVKAKVGTRPFEAVTSEGKKRFDFGTIVIPVGIQPEKADTIRKLVEKAAEEDGIRVFALNTGMTVTGIDLGSPSFQVVQLPKVALLVGQGVSFTDAGEAWHVLDRRFEMEVSLLELSLFNRADLSRYTTIVMVGGTYTGIDSSGRESLKHWIDNGGTLIAMENAIEWTINNKIAAARLRKDESSKKDTIVARRSYADEEAFTRALEIPGTIFEVRYDRTHPLLFGYQDSLMYVFRNTTVFLDPSKNPYATPAQYTEKPLISGYMNKQHEKYIKGSAALLIQANKSGRVILMTDNPNFRAFWYGTNKLFLNSIFFGATIRASSGRTEK